MKKFLKMTPIFVITLILASVIIIAAASGDRPVTVDDGRQGYLYPKLNTAKHLYVIKRSAMNGTELVMIETLQGILAQTKAEIYIDAGDSYAVWLQNLREKYGITYEYVRSPWDLIARFKSRLNDKGFIVYNPWYEEINVACTLSGVLRHVAVDNSLAGKAKAHGLVQRMNAGGKNELWVFRNYKNKLNNGIIFSQIYTNPALRDYGVALKALYYADASLYNMDEIYPWLQKNSPVMGWGPRGETDQVRLNSSFGMFTVASDHAYNLSVFSGLPREELKQKSARINAKEADDVHYVTFIMSDGDNVQWYCNGAPLDPERMGSAKKGVVPFGWSISPSLADLAPNIMRYCYDNATDNDCFVAAVSGVGYIYPTQYPKADLLNFAKLTNAYMKRADLKSVSILDLAPSQDVIDAYAAQGQIEGGFYFYGYQYAGGQGAIFWSHGKPFVATRETLWDTSPERMAVRLNAYKRDPKSPEGYTVVNVHAWSHNYQDVLKIASMLDRHVVIVTPDEFIRLMKKNLPQKNVEVLHDVDSFDYSSIQEHVDAGYIDFSAIDKMPPANQLEYTFDKDLEGWVGVTGGKQYDKADWTQFDGNGALRLDGSKFGNMDAQPNSYFYKKLILPQADKLYFNFKVKSDGPDKDGNLQVEIIDAEKRIYTILPWKTIKSADWLSMSVEISKFAGQTVTILVEQADSGEGSGEYIYVDEIRISDKVKG